MGMNARGERIADEDLIDVFSSDFSVIG
jgi:hypothetical protein